MDEEIIINKLNENYNESKIIQEELKTIKEELKEMGDALLVTYKELAKIKEALNEDYKVLVLQKGGKI